MSVAARRSRGGNPGCLRAAMSLAVLSSLAGCAGETGTGGDEPGGASAEPQETGPAGAGGGGDGSGGAGGEAPAEPTRTGYVLVARMSHLETDDPGSALAGLLAELESEPRRPSSVVATCEEVVMGACTYRRCEVVVPGASTSTPPTYSSAGTLSVGGDAEPLTASPGEDSTYKADWSPDLLGIDQPWPSGGTVTVDASGDEVPAFTASVRAPTRYLLDASTYPFGTVDRTEDLVLQWTALGDGDSTVFLDIESRAGDGVGARIECEVPVVDEQLVVPRELLARLPPAARDHEDGPIVWIGSYERTWVTAGDWNVSVAVSDYPVPLFVAIE